jgi:hypothetical protein
MIVTAKAGLGASLKLEIIKRIIDGKPVSPLVDDLKPQEIMLVHQFILEKALDFGKTVNGNDFSQKDISQYLEPTDINKFEDVEIDTTNKNLSRAIEKTKNQIDSLCQIIREYTLN